MSTPINGITINGIEVENTFAEAFAMKATRLIITAIDYHWARQAAESMTGFATSVIGCGVEAGIERRLGTHETPDGRPGFTVLMFSTSKSLLIKHLGLRIGQCVLTCPTTAVFSGIESDIKIPLGNNTRYFGDGYQISKVIGEKRYWRIPVMDGEFICEDTTSMVPAIGGGNFIVMARSQAEVIQACRVAIEAMSYVPNIVLPFPGGGVRSGSKVGSRYKKLVASTNDRYCPTLRGIVDTQLKPKAESIMEIVIDGLIVQDIINAMRCGIKAVCDLGSQHGIIAISAGNYDGNLGGYQFHLWEIVEGEP